MKILQCILSGDQEKSRVYILTLCYTGNPDLSSTFEGKVTKLSF